MRVATLTQETLGSQQPKHPGLTEEEAKLYEQIPKKIDYVWDSSFSLPLTEEKLFGADAENIETPIWRHFPVIDKDSEEIQATNKKKAPSQKHKALLFLRYNYARYKLSRLAIAQQRRYSLKRARQMVVWHRRAKKIESDIVQANLGLVITIAKRRQFDEVEFRELISEGNMALLRGVRNFDVSRGLRFSTYACRAILRSFGRLTKKTRRYHQRFSVEFGPKLEPNNFDDLRHEAQRQARIDDLRRALVSNGANLTDLEAIIISERYGFSQIPKGEKQTFVAIGQRVGLCAEWVRRLEKKALQKLKCALTF